MKTAPGPSAHSDGSPKGLQEREDMIVVILSPLLLVFAWRPRISVESTLIKGSVVLVKRSV
jgi:hypothetical protein